MELPLKFSGLHQFQPIWALVLSIIVFIFVLVYSIHKVSTVNTPISVNTYTLTNADISNDDSIFINIGDEDPLKTLMFYTTFFLNPEADLNTTEICS